MPAWLADTWTMITSHVPGLGAMLVGLAIAFVIIICLFDSLN